MIAIFKVSVEIQGNVRRFKSIVDNEQIKIRIVSSDDNIVNVVSSYWNGSYEVIDTNIEQGRRFLIEVGIGVFVLPIAANYEIIKDCLKSVCEISNKSFSVVECKIVENPI